MRVTWLLRLALIAQAAGCATAPHSPPMTESEQIREAFTHPYLDTCDDIVCYYRPITFFSVRDVRCAPAASRPGRAGTIVDCSYERSRLPTHWLTVVEIAPAGERPSARPLAGPWKKARTMFEIHDSRRWFVVEDETNWD